MIACPRAPDYPRREGEAAYDTLTPAVATTRILSLPRMPSFVSAWSRRRRSLEDDVLFRGRFARAVHRVNPFAVSFRFPAGVRSSDVDTAEFTLTRNALFREQCAS